VSGHDPIQGKLKDVAPPGTNHQGSCRGPPRSGITAGHVTPTGCPGPLVPADGSVSPYGRCPKVLLSSGCQLGPPPGATTITVVLPHDLLEADEDGFHVSFHERGTQNLWDRKFVGNEEAVKDLNTSDIDVEVY